MTRTLLPPGDKRLSMVEEHWVGLTSSTELQRESTGDSCRMF